MRSVFGAASRSTAALRTQSFCPDGFGKPCHLDKLADPVKVNALRAELGLEPLTAEEISGARDEEE